MGAIEACAVYTFYIARICPSFSLFTVPMVYQNTQETIEAIEGPIGDLLFNELRAKGYFPLGWVDWPLEVGGLESNAPIHTPLDLKGKVIRPISRETALYLENYGNAQVAFVSGAELYTAIQRGTLDGAVAGLDHAVERKLSEVAPYFCVLPGFVIAHAVILVNKRFYNKLPIDLQKVLREAAIETQKNSYKVGDKMVTVITEKAKACLKEVYYPTKDDLQLWNANLNNFFQEALKNNPETLKLVTSERKRMKKADGGK
jgi:TRAP-type C4-dicarboxylate transport system substrate-binding protein